MVPRRSTRRVLLVFIVVALLAFLTLHVRAACRASSAEALAVHFAGKTVALVIAHPDDEAMFFGPTLSALRGQVTGMKILCLSTGNADGLGATRAQELVASANIFGIAAQDVVVFDDPRVQDAMGVVWPADVIAELVEPHIAAVDVVLTFDADGVSGHGNHRSLYVFAKEHLVGHGKQVWALSSCSILRKYISFFDIPPTYALARLAPVRGQGAAFVATNGVHEYTLGRDAMTRAHVSQMRWFRWGWISLSRYMVVNDLRML
ncbi:putative deacetylase LmbE-like domain-containing protein [Limtongia smithiae]|uniref:putative deacetylase LmbE-like domain-containing protein n=1 Tax=Limtongia smithiae TaxID=1125753 RepID=UPI0034CDD3EC